MLLPMTATAEEYSDNATTLAERGAVLNSQGRHTEAADLLERALLLNPDLKQAVTEYLMALDGIERGHKERQLPAPPQIWQLGGDIQFRIGGGDNLNQGASVESVLLTFPEGYSLMELEPEQRPQSGGGVELQLSATALRQLEDGDGVGVSGKIVARETNRSGYADYLGIDLQTLWSHPLEPGVLLAMAGISLLEYPDNKPSLSALQSAARYRWQDSDSDCAPQLGVDLLIQHQGGGVELDGRYLGGVAGVECRSTDRYGVVATAGKDWAHGSRAGGDQSHYGIRLYRSWDSILPVAGARYTIKGSYLRQQDQETYSAWIANGDKRKLNHLKMELKGEWPVSYLGKQWRATAEIGWLNQNSNIPLFDTESNELWLGLNWRW